MFRQGWGRGLSTRCGLVLCGGLSTRYQVWCVVVWCGGLSIRCGVLWWSIYQVWNRIGGDFAGPMDADHSVDISILIVIPLTTRKVRMAFVHMSKSPNTIAGRWYWGSGSYYVLTLNSRQLDWFSPTCASRSIKACTYIQKTFKPEYNCQAFWEVQLHCLFVSGNFKKVLLMYFICDSASWHREPTKLVNKSQAPAFI